MIPEYTIVRIALDEHMRRQLADEAHNDRPRVPDRERASVTAAVRLCLGAALHAVANAIEPARPVPACSPGHVT